MKFVKNMLVSMLLLSSLICIHPSSSKANANTVFLNIDGYYLLYSAPSTPYLDENNRMMVPLRSFSSLFGATVTYNAVSQTATVMEGNNSLKLTANSKTIEVNGQKQELDTTPVLKNNGFFLPFKSVVDAFHIKSSILDMGYGSGTTIVVSDARFLEQSPLKEINDQRSVDEEQYINYGLFPKSFAMNMKDNSINISMISRNILGVNLDFKNIKSGIWVVSENDTQQAVSKDTADYKIKKGDMIVNNYSANYEHISDVKYIFVFPRIRDTQQKI